MKRLIFCLFLSLLFAGTKAQPSKAQLEGAKFAIMKRTVEFLSEDTAFKNVQTHTCEGCTTVVDLKRFVLDNKLINADIRVINPLDKMQIDTSALKWRQSLNNFKQQAINQISGVERAYRKELPGYNDYAESLDALVEDVMPGEDNGAASSGSNDSAGSGQAGILPQGTSKTNSIQDLLLSWLPYIVAAVLLIALIYVLSEKSKLKKRKTYYKDKMKRLENEMIQRKQIIADLTEQKEKLVKELNNSELDRNALEDRLKSLELKNVQKITPQAAPPVAAVPATAEKPMLKPIIQKPKVPAATKRYARYADMGDGFSNAELLDKPDGETIFELTIAPNNTGEYTVTNNPEGQRYALSNVKYFLGKACKFDLLPSSDTLIIRTDQPGTVKLTSGKWTIVNPAKISFG